jgi:hypothetical protein
MSHRRRLHALLALALAALVALPASLALAGPRRALRKVPPVGTTLVSADQKARLTVVADRTAGKRAKAVVLAWSLTARCPAGPSLVQLRARAAVRGNAFASTVDGAGVKQRLTGRFASRRKASGTVQLSFPDQRGGTCDTGVQRFSVQG